MIVVCECGFRSEGGPQRIGIFSYIRECLLVTRRMCLIRTAEFQTVIFGPFVEAPVHRS